MARPRLRLALLLLVALAAPATARAPSAGSPLTFRPFSYAELPDASALPVTEATIPPAAVASMSGTASWYRWHVGEAAAGPALRRGDWRGRIVTVCAARCIRVRLTDWCQCYGARLIDLDARSFAQLAPLSAGLVRVQITY